MDKMQKKIEAACSYLEISKAELGRRLGMSQQNMSKRVTRGKFTEEELHEMAHAMGAKYHSYFEFPDGTKIE